MFSNASRSPVGAIVNEAHIDGLLPSQHFSPRRPLTPEKLLMLAVLHDAWNCVEKYRKATHPVGQRLYRDAVGWITAREPRWPFSFERLCAALDINAAAVRQRLRVISPDDFTPSTRAYLSIDRRPASQAMHHRGRM